MAEVVSPRRAARLTRLVETSMADYYEALYPAETSPSSLLVKLLAHRPRGSEHWDAEDITLFARDMHTWLAEALFDPAVHPRLCAVGALAGLYEFATALEPASLIPGGRPGAVTMKGYLCPKKGE